MLKYTALMIACAGLSVGLSGCYYGPPPPVTVAPVPVAPVYYAQPYYAYPGYYGAGPGYYGPGARLDFNFWGHGHRGGWR